MASRYGVAPPAAVPSLPLLSTTADNSVIDQPDGYLTEERKAADPDQGFSTFFSETGMLDPQQQIDPQR